MARIDVDFRAKAQSAPAGHSRLSELARSPRRPPRATVAGGASYSTAPLRAAAVADDLTLRDLGTGASSALPKTKKKLVRLLRTAHVTFYSPRSALPAGAEHATAWYARHFLP